MITTRYLIPLFFAMACMVGMGWTCSGQGALVEKRVSLEMDQTEEMGPIELDEKGRYVVEVAMRGKPSSGFLANLELAVQREGDEEPLFELEDGYWAESGRWREGGESGTWYEKNSATKLYFAAPQGGTYRFTLKQKNTQGQSVPVRFTLSKKPYSVDAFLLGFFIFMVITAVVLWRRGRLFKSYLGQMGKGSQFKWNDKLWEVHDILLYGEPNQRAPYPNRPGEYSIAYQIKNTEGEERFLSIESFEYEYEDAEGDDYDATEDIIMISDVLTEKEEEQLRQQGRSNFNFRGKNFRAEGDYSGVSLVYTEKEGMVFTSKVSETVFLAKGGGANYRGQNNSRKTIGIPNEDGDPVVSVARYEDGDEEWDISLRVDWKNIALKKIVARKDIDFNAGNAA
jgi:hypothetical protein